MDTQGELIQIRNIDELKKLLFIQKTITQQAKAEFLAISNDDLIPACDNEEQSIACAYQFMAKERQLLEKYAKYPTLTEFKLMPNSQDGTKWGATFGVTLFVGELIFEQAKAMHPHFAPVMRQMFVLLLAELERPDAERVPLNEPLEKALKFRITTESGDTVDEEKQQAYIRTMVQGLVETFLILGVEYGLISSTDAGYVITPLGTRVLLHLIDAAKFIDELTKAHQKFQSAKPRLSMS